ncbi:MAG: hypothetical protein ACOCQD_01535 [archaeon]
MQKINKRKLYYANYLGTTDETTTIDGVERKTGNKIHNYSEPELLMVNVSGGRSGKIDRAFGKSLEYDKYFLIENLPDDFDENSIIWYDGKDISESHNYEVERIHNPLNSFTVLIKRVK